MKTLQNAPIDADSLIIVPVTYELCRKEITRWVITDKVTGEELIEVESLELAKTLIGRN